MTKMAIPKQPITKLTDSLHQVAVERSCQDQEQVHECITSTSEILKSIQGRNTPFSTLNLCSSHTNYKVKEGASIMRFVTKYKVDNTDFFINVNFSVERVEPTTYPEHNGQQHLPSL